MFIVWKHLYRQLYSYTKGDDKKVIKTMMAQDYAQRWIEKGILRFWAIHWIKMMETMFYKDFSGGNQQWNMVQRIGILSKPNNLTIKESKPILDLVTSILIYHTNLTT